MGSQRDAGILHVIAQKTGEEGEAEWTLPKELVFLTPNVTFKKTAGGFPRHRLNLDILMRVLTENSNVWIIRDIFHKILACKGIQTAI